MKTCKSIIQNDINTNILDVKTDHYTNCEWCKDKKRREDLYIPWGMWCDWIFISTKMGNKEWGAVFWTIDNKIERFQIPKQEVDIGECEFKEELGGNGIIHSHHNMGAFHSPQDDKYARNLYTYSIVLSNGNNIATKRIKLPCGGFGYINVNLILTDTPVGINISKIKKREYRQPYSPIQPTITYNDNIYDKRENNTAIDDIPCATCTEFNCFDCKKNMGQIGAYDRPFCDICHKMSPATCQDCWKMHRFLSHYPEYEY